MRNQLFSPAFKSALGGYDAIEVFNQHAAKANTDDPLALIQYLDLKTYLVGDINTKVDRASMAHSLEVREPLMDHELIEWLATLRSSQKIRGQETKYLLKKSMEPYLPNDVLYRQKMGFSVPLARWFRGPLKAARPGFAPRFSPGGYRLVQSRIPATPGQRPQQRQPRLQRVHLDTADVRSLSAQRHGTRRTRMIRTLHVLDHSIPLHSGYTFRTAALLREQRALGWETFHLTSPKQGKTLAPVEDVDGLRFYRTPMASGMLASLPVAKELALMRQLETRLEEVAREVRPDIIHAHSPVLNAFPAIKVARKLGIPVVYEIRAFWEDAAVNHGSTTEDSLRYRITRNLETRAIKQVDHVFTICEGLRADILARGIPASKVTVIPNAVDINAFHLANPPDPELQKRWGLTGKTVIGFIGSFYSYEGLDLLLDALPAIIKQKSDICVLLVGGGPQEANLRQQAEQLGLRDHVIFTGRVPHSEVNRYYDLIRHPRLPAPPDAPDRTCHATQAPGSHGPRPAFCCFGCWRSQRTRQSQQDRYPVQSWRPAGAGTSHRGTAQPQATLARTQGQRPSVC